ncbi:hypothetical protein [Gloeocapsa sp. PCC 73106]|uniref:hypothetical protein n=1 Tax=Gloeocapsa sp. PCC 73106 TaxID=102232 RepID=UPI001EE64D0E|nr:hypothetical protein [Gloeocapsa sp. PCC 73106]
MVKYTDKSDKVIKLSRRERQEVEIMQQQRLQEQRMRDVKLILENLFTREEATVKLILECLYEVGSANLINKKVRFRPLNRFVKAIASMSKPAFRLWGFRWFKGNCPQLIADWLESKVTF